MSAVATRTPLVLDGNEAAARVAYMLSEVMAIYPITPSSSMGEHADAWSAAGKPNLWGAVPEVAELQSEGGAAASMHGVVQRGSLGSTFTASQGLLLMIPNMYKIAGELTPAVIHVAARTVATHALSIFGDHSDVMATRQTGWAMLCASSVQEAQDFALISHAATVRSRVPFLHFFDGFRTSHELATIDPLEDEDLAALTDEDAIRAHRERALSPEQPVLRGSAQNPDVFFQAREACNPFYDAVPDEVSSLFAQLEERTGRSYDLIQYHGHPEAERVVVVMGSAAQTMRAAADALNEQGEKVGVLTVRLYRPFPEDALIAALPDTVREIAVLDRTKEPGAPGEPLYLDVAAAVSRRLGPTAPRVVGGRYGLSSKEFTPRMAVAVFNELDRPAPSHGFTVGIVDDVTQRSLPIPEEGPRDPAKLRALFYGLGSDGTVGANRNTVDILAKRTGMPAQGFFEFDSRKAGAVTVSNVRIDDEPIWAPYLIEEADLVAVHQFNFLERMDVLAKARRGATVLLNSPYGADEVWDHLPREVQQELIDKELRLFVVDAYTVAQEAKLGARINSVMQPCFFAVADLLPIDEAIGHIKDAIDKTYGKRGRTIVERNFAAVDGALEGLQEVAIPDRVDSDHVMRPPVPEHAPDFVQRVTARIIEGKGDTLPVSALPVDGTFPTGTSTYEKRQLAQELPIWDPEVCIDCGKCAIVCPHATIRMKVFDPETLELAPEGFKSKDYKAKDLRGNKLTVQVAPDDCTGCGICVDICPATSKEAAGHKAINMRPAEEHRDAERPHWEFFESIPEFDRSQLKTDTVKGSQLLDPLFEFSSACSGCGETPYLGLLTRLFGDRIIVANATGCSSIYGGNLPVTPWAKNSEGRGPAWSNSLFEDNAEFGFGIELATANQQTTARALVAELADQIGGELATGLLEADQSDDAAIAAQRERVAALKERLAAIDSPRARSLAAIADSLVDHSVWIIGGDGWAYDIDYHGLDHILASGRNVNVLVMDTEVYSNTGGQASKATPRAATAKFATGGKRSAKKDLGMLAMAYGDVYVAQVALGANDMQTVRAFQEAAAYDGPSLIVAYSTCIAHGIDMTTSMTHQKDAVQTGYWPLFRYQPTTEEGQTPLRLDSKEPKKPVREFALKEARFAMLQRTAPQESDRLLNLMQADIDERWKWYSQLAEIKRRVPDEATGNGHGPDGNGQDTSSAQEDS